jgi:hypothetical protein
MSAFRTSPVNFNDGSMEGYIQQLASNLRRRTNPDRDLSRIVAENNWNIRTIRQDLVQTKHTHFNTFNQIKNSLAELDNRIVNLEGIKKGNKQSKSPLTLLDDDSDGEYYGGKKKKKTRRKKKGRRRKKKTKKRRKKKGRRRKKKTKKRRKK